MEEKTKGLNAMEQYIPYDELPYRNKLILDIWEAWKDFYGFRPRHIDFDSMQDEELEELYKKIVEKDLTLYEIGV